MDLVNINLLVYGPLPGLQEFIFVSIFYDLKNIFVPLGL